MKKSKVLPTPVIDLNKIYQECFGQVRSYVQYNSGNSDDAYDVFQDAITVCWYKLKTKQINLTQEELAPYIIRVCKNKWIDELRKRKVKIEQMEHFQHVEDTMDETPEEVALLNACFAELGEKCQKLLHQFYYEKIALVDLANLNGLTPDSIKTTKYRCMQKLKKIFLTKQSKDEQLSHS